MAQAGVVCANLGPSPGNLTETSQLAARKEPPDVLVAVYGLALRTAGALFSVVGQGTEFSHSPAQFRALAGCYSFICRTRYLYECTGECKAFTLALAFPLSPLPVLWLSEEFDQVFFPFVEVAAGLSLGAGQDDVYTLWVPNKCYLSNLLKVCAFAKSQAVPWHKRAALLTHGAWQHSAAKTVKVCFYPGFAGHW